MLLTLDSSTISNQNSDDFTIDFSSPLKVLDGIHEIGLIKCNLWYSFFNVSDDFNNRIIRYTNNTAQTRTVTIPAGNYTILQLNTYISAAMVANGDTASIIIEPNYSTLKVKITISNGYSLDLTASNFNLLLGWNQGIYNFNGSQEGQNQANINRDINSLLIHCDILGSSFKNGLLSDILFSFVPNVPPGANIELEPQHLIYLPVIIPDHIRKIRMYITDQLGRRVNLNQQPVTYLLHLRKRVEIFNPTIKNI